MRRVFLAVVAPLLSGGIGGEIAERACAAVAPHQSCRRGKRLRPRHGRITSLVPALRAGPGGDQVGGRLGHVGELRL
eukprot:8967156-Alexandrium_andersonii.AAC.1